MGQSKMGCYRIRRTMEGVGKGCGTKREWQKAREEESISEASGDGKRMKFQKLGTDRNYIEMEVASFDWP